jgi:ubiquinone biosynthesis protein UbiJ
MKDALVVKINTILQSDSLKNIYSNYFKEKLHNKVVKICVDDIKLNLFIIFQDNNMELSIDEIQQDVEISGTLSSFIFYSAIGGSDLYSSKINISGDVETANSLNNLFKETDILRGIIMEIIGQKASSSLFSILDPIKDKMSESSERNKNAFSDFLKYDVSLVPTKEDINKYIDDVDEIKSRTDKLLNKIK